MDFHQLKYFQTLAQIGNFTKAANDLVLSQSALSRSILKLEEELGIPLFERKSRGVVLTRYGEIFLEHVNRSLQEIDKAKQEINNMIDPFHGTISLGFIQPLGSSFIPDLISHFGKEKPGVKYHLTQGITNKILTGIQCGDIDVGFCTSQERIETLSYFPIMDQEIFLIVHKKHRLANKEEVDLCEVANDPFVLYKPETALYDVIEKLCSAAGFNPTMSFQAFDERTIAGLVGAKFGVALIPFIPGLDMEKISLIHIRKPYCLMSIEMVWRSNGYLSPAVATFKSYVENTIGLTK